MYAENLVDYVGEEIISFVRSKGGSYLPPIPLSDALHEAGIGVFELGLISSLTLQRLEQVGDRVDKFVAKHQVNNSEDADWNSYGFTYELAAPLLVALHPDIPFPFIRHLLLLLCIDACVGPKLYSKRDIRDALQGLGRLGKQLRGP